MMRRSKQYLQYCAAILGLLCILILDPAIVKSAPLSVNDMHPEGGCYYNLELYDHGEQIRTNEPCLNCTCTNHMLMCYLNTCPYSKPLGSDCEVERLNGQCCPSIKCPEVPVFIPDSQPFVAVGKPPTTPVPLPPPHPVTTAVSLEVISAKGGCYFQDLLYPEGHLLPSEDPCELCYCIRNHSACVVQNCTLQIPGCTPQYNVGTCCPVSYDCENNLISTTTTTTTTTSTVLPTTGCYVDDIFYYDGSIINTGGPCRHCYCMKGELICAVTECKAPEMEGCTAILDEDRCCPFKYDCPVTESPVTPSIDVVTTDGTAIVDIETPLPAEVATSKPFYPVDNIPVEITSPPPLATISDETDEDSKYTAADTISTTTELPKQKHSTGITDDNLEATTSREPPPEIVETKIEAQDDSTTEIVDAAIDGLKRDETTVGPHRTTQKNVPHDATIDAKPLSADDNTAATAAAASTTSSLADSETSSNVSDELSYTPNTVPDDDIRDATQPTPAISGEPEAKFSPGVVEITTEYPSVPVKHTEAVDQEITTEVPIKSQAITSISPVGAEVTPESGGAFDDIATSSRPQGSYDEGTTEDDQETTATTKQPVEKTSAAPLDRTNTEVSYTVSLNESNVPTSNKPTSDYQTASESRVEPTTEFSLDSTKLPASVNDDDDDDDDEEDSSSAPTAQPTDTTSVKHVSPSSVEVTISQSSLSSPPSQQDGSITESTANTRLPSGAFPADESVGPKENETTDVNVPTTSSPLESVTDDAQTIKIPVVPSLPDEGAGYCHHDGITFTHGETVPSKDYCQLNCSCQRGLIECQKMRCDIPELVKNLTCRELFEDGRCCPRYICGQTDTGHGIFTAESQVTILPITTSSEATTKISGSTTSAPSVVYEVVSSSSAVVESIIGSTSQAPVVPEDKEAVSGVTVAPQIDEVTQEIITTAIPQREEAKPETTVAPEKGVEEQATTVFPQKDETGEDQETTVYPQSEYEKITQGQTETTIRAIPQDQESTIDPESAIEHEATTISAHIPDDVEHQTTTTSPPIDDEKFTDRIEDSTSVPPLVPLFDFTPETVAEVTVTDDYEASNQTITENAEVVYPSQMTTANSSLPQIPLDSIGSNITDPESSVATTEAPLSPTSDEPIFENRQTESPILLQEATPSVPLIDEPSSIVVTQPPVDIPPLDVTSDIAGSTKAPVLPAASKTTLAPEAAETTDLGLNENLDNVTQDAAQDVTQEPSSLNSTSVVSKFNGTILSVPPQVNESQTEDIVPESSSKVTSSPARSTEGSTSKPYFITDDARPNVTEISIVVTSSPIEMPANATQPSLSLDSDATRYPTVEVTIAPPASAPEIKDDHEEASTTSQSLQDVDDATSIGVTEEFIPSIDIREKLTTTLQPSSRPSVDNLTVGLSTSTQPAPQRIDEIIYTTAPVDVIDKQHNATTEKPSDESTNVTIPEDHPSNETNSDYPPANATKPEYSASDTTATTATIPRDIVTGRPQTDGDEETTDRPVPPIKDGVTSTTVAATTTDKADVSSRPDEQLSAQTRLPSDQRVSLPPTTLPVDSVVTEKQTVTLTTVSAEITTFSASHRNYTESILTSSSSIKPTHSDVSRPEISAPSTVPSVVVDHHRINVTASTELLPHLPTTGFDEHLEGVSPDAGIPITSENFTLEDGQCIYESRLYSSAQQIPREDPCDFCFCFRGDIICLQQSCPPPIDGCYEEEIPGFCCPRYECPVTAVTLNVTDPKTPPYPLTASRYRTVRALTQLQVVVCEFRNKFYNKGETIASASGPCMDCLCGEQGTMKCTPKKCQLDPLWRTLPNLRKVSTLGVTRLGRNRF